VPAITSSAARHDQLGAAAVEKTELLVDQCGGPSSGETEGRRTTAMGIRSWPIAKMMERGARSERPK